ncbi:response regulator [Winogradskyella psychrotolerans]|uniref:response regulator n=1 Tax=Winogradskyella psychrotolerans TaxID=1344585 RepID=UPI001C0649F6|nr:response regulator [Winogradskyella psychrotolerans]MBU2930135.1 response regulator [Winogradskyella psychrotolerans]
MKNRLIILFLFVSCIFYGQDKKKLDSLNYLLQLAKANKNWEVLSDLYFAQANNYYESEDYALAIPILLKIDSISEKHSIKDSTTVLAILKRAEISKLTFTKESSQVAYELGKEALKLAEDINSQESIHLAYVKLADYCQLTKRFDEAKIYVDKGLQYYINKNNGDEDKISRLYLIESAYYLDQDSLIKGEESRYKAILYLEDKGNDYEMAKAKYYFGHYIRYDKKEYKEALVFLEEAKDLFETTNNNDGEIYHRCLRDLAICYDAIGDYNNSSKYYKDAYMLKIELNKRANRTLSRNLETQYETENKKQEIELLTTQKQLVEGQKINQRNLFLGGLVLTSIAGLFFFFLFKNRQKTTRKLQELDGFKSKLFANISHEFRTPLTLISGPIDKRLNSKGLNDEDRTEFKMIQRNSDRLLNLVNQLLDLSKLESGHLKLKVGQGNLSVLLKSMASSFQHKAIQKQINYTINIEEIENVWFDKDVIEKTVINLLSNAFKYTPENGNIHFIASVIDDKLQLNIENNSKVLTKEQIENIFNRFYQADENTEGVGIGLSLVKEIVNLSYGIITVENTSSKTMVFNVQLPILKSQFKPKDLTDDTIDLSIAEQKDYTVETENETIQIIDEDLPILLIVDDHEDIRAFVKTAFKNNYQVVEAANGEIGVEKAIELIPDIIISDVMMPKVNGFQLSEILKQDERTCHIPIILLTAKADDTDKFMGLETGADDFIVKPFKIKGLEARVKNLIVSRLKLRERYSQEVILRPKDIAISNFDKQFLEKIQLVLNQNLTEPNFSAKDFSKVVGMSRMQLHRKLKALTGLSATEFVRSQRLKLAADLLKKSDANVSEIGYSVGFNDHSYFTKCFKEVYHCTPTEFANRS